MAETKAFYREIGRRIRDAREDKHLTQEALALIVSLNRTSVTNIEKGRQQLLVHTLVEIAKALDVSPESLLPKPLSSAGGLDELLKDQSPEAQEWIRRAAVDRTVKE